MHSHFNFVSSILSKLFKKINIFASSQQLWGFILWNCSLVHGWKWVKEIFCLTCSKLNNFCCFLHIQYFISAAYLMDIYLVVKI